MLKRLQIVDPLHLTASRIISILAEDDTNVRATEANNRPGAIRLDIEVSLAHLIVLVRSEAEEIILLFRCVFWNFLKHWSLVQWFIRVVNTTTHWLNDPKQSPQNVASVRNHRSVR